MCRRERTLEEVVGAGGFEPPTCCSQSNCATPALRPGALDSRPAAWGCPLAAPSRTPATEPRGEPHASSSSTASAARRKTGPPSRRRCRRASSPLALDFPGFGKAVRPHDSYDPASLARWVLGELDDRDVETAVVAGHSLGGRVAGELALLAPKRVLALALVSPLGSAPYGFTDTLKWKAMSRAALVSSAPETSHEERPRLRLRRRRAREEGVRRARDGSPDRAATRPPRSGRSNARSTGSSPPRPSRSGSPGSKVPLLLVTGAEDPLAPPKDVETIRRGAARRRRTSSSPASATTPRSRRRRTWRSSSSELSKKA